MEWLEPWWSTEKKDVRFHEVFLNQLKNEISPKHSLHGLPVILIARGNGDDALFLILDGTERVADVHLTWSKNKQEPPWPVTSIYQNLDEWVQEVMIPQHKEWLE